jgi:hypothetical protein
MRELLSPPSLEPLKNKLNRTTVMDAGKIPESASGLIACGIHMSRLGAISGTIPKPFAIATMNRLNLLDLKFTALRIRVPVAATIPNITRPTPPRTAVGRASTKVETLGSDRGRP